MPSHLRRSSLAGGSGLIARAIRGGPDQYQRLADDRTTPQPHGPDDHIATGSGASGATSSGSVGITIGVPAGSGASMDHSSSSGGLSTSLSSSSRDDMMMHDTLAARASIPDDATDIDPKLLADHDSQFIAMDGLMVHYKLWRGADDTKRSRPALVLLHGFGGSVFSWKRAWRGLTDISSVVLAFDRPGFGLTTRLLPNSSGDYGTYRDDKVHSFVAFLTSFID